MKILNLMDLCPKGEIHMWVSWQMSGTVKVEVESLL